MSFSLTPVILCGGSGTRLWPLSRAMYPKQFVEFTPGETLFKSTVKRLHGLSNISSPIVVCNENHRFLSKRNLDELNQPGTIIVEPFARNTAPAIALAAFKAIQTDENAILLVLPSDHTIDNEPVFAKAVEDAAALAKQEFLVTFGIQPTGPETGYGYIAASKALTNNGFSVKQFVEKPQLDKAKAMLAAGDFFWNSGMFVFKASTYLKALSRFAPEMFEHCKQAMVNAKQTDSFVFPMAAEMETCPSDSIDYAVMEKAEKVAVVPLNVLWNDLGAWNAMHAVGKKDEHQNVLVGDTLQIACTNSYIHSTTRLVAAVDMQDVAVIETSDAVLVSPLSSVQKVKNIVSELQDKQRSEAILPPIVHRPWGTYESIAQGMNYQAKRIVVNPGQALSLQLHHHRSEHWTVVKGTPEITVGDCVKTYVENDSVYIPVESVHRLINNTKTPVIIIEVQCGDYLGEDDIVRLSDVYSRK